MDRDTAGQERFAPIGSMYYNGAKAVIFTYDITRVNYKKKKQKKTRVKYQNIFNITVIDVSQKKTFDSLPLWRQKFDDRNEG